MEPEGPVFLLYLFLDELQPGSVFLSFFWALAGPAQSHWGHAGLAQTSNPIRNLTPSTW